MEEKISKIMVIGFTEEINDEDHIKKAKEEIEEICEKYNLLCTEKAHEESWINYSLDSDNSDDIAVFYEHCDLEFSDNIDALLE